MTAIAIEPTFTASHDEGSADDYQLRAGFEAAAAPQLGPLHSFALKLARNPDDAEDLVSDTYLRALERWRQFRPGTNMRAWLFTILYHVFVSRKRRIGAREVLSTDDPESPVGPETIVGDDDPEGAFYDSFIDEEIVASIEALPSEYRTAVLMSDVHGMRYGDIAEVLGVPEGTVKSRLFRGRRILQRRLRDYAVAGGYVRAGAVPSASAS
ncbi:MAG: sigma-70 family RNA polymerase sigma factor [Gemmatimonadetes bacterium]|nr:sigma-70 family RNA polymerase sigma factor [Gemmatimonadota bacterium]